MVDRTMQNFVKVSKEQQTQFEAGILAKLSKIVPTTPQSDMGSCNLKTNHLVIPEFVECPHRHVEDQPSTSLKNLKKRYLFFN